MNYNKRKRASNKGEGMGGGMRQARSLRGVRRNDLGRLALFASVRALLFGCNLTPLNLKCHTLRQLSLFMKLFETVM